MATDPNYREPEVTTTDPAHRDPAVRDTHYREPTTTVASASGC